MYKKAAIPCLGTIENFSWKLFRLPYQNLRSHNIAEETIWKIKRVGEKDYQSRMNRGGRDRKRERAFNSSRQDFMVKFHETLLGLWNGHIPITRNRVLQLMSRYVFWWTWRTFGKTQAITPADIDQRIRRWSHHLYSQHDVRQNSYVIFGDKTSASVDGELKGKNLAPVGVISVKVVRTNEKQTLTIFLAALFSVKDKGVYPRLILQKFNSWKLIPENSSYWI